MATWFILQHQACVVIW